MAGFSLHLLPQKFHIVLVVLHVCDRAGLMESIGLESCRTCNRITIKSKKIIIHYAFNECHGNCLGISVVLN